MMDRTISSLTKGVNQQKVALIEERESVRKIILELNRDIKLSISPKEKDLFKKRHIESTIKEDRLTLSIRSL